MIKHLFFILFLMIIKLSCLSQNIKEYYFKFSIKNRNEIEKLTRIISIDKVKGKTVYAFATNKNFQKFKSLHYPYTFIHNLKSDFKADMATTIAEMSNWDKYPTYSVYTQLMNNFVSSYPNLCKLVKIGTTVNGKDLLVLKISDNINSEEEEPEFLYSSTMHGDETTGMILMLRLADSLLSSYESVPEIKNLINSTEIYINPNANPDGTYAGGNNTIGSYSTRSNSNGVDLNRNFPDAIDGDHPDDELWQPETMAMINFAKEHNFVMSANFHGGAELANYPWDNTYNRHVDDNWFINISRNYATSCQNNSPIGYFTEENNGITNGADWYKVYGGRQDYFTYFHHCREITFEISKSKIVSASKLPDYWNYNKQALIDYINEVNYGFKGTVKDIEGNPIYAMIIVEGHDSETDSSYVFTDPDVGDYHRLIEPGTYTLIASAHGFFNDTLKSVTISSKQTIYHNFTLEIDSISSKINPLNISDTLYKGEIKEHKLVIKNTGYKTLEYNIESNFKDWITINKLNNTILSSKEDTLIFSLNAQKLNTGEYKDTIRIFENDGFCNIIPVKLLVKYPQFIQNNIFLTDYSVYPNPFNKEIILRFHIKNSSKINIRILNLNGTELFNSCFNVEKNMYNTIHIEKTSHLSNGIYIIQLYTNKSSVCKKIIKQ